MLVIIANRIFGRSFSNRARSAGAADHGRVLPNDDGAFFAATYLPGYLYVLRLLIAYCYMLSYLHTHPSRDTQSLMSSPYVL